MATSTPIVTKVDHVFVPLVDAAKAHAFLTETLGLPVAWPYAEYGAFSSGGSVLGSINLEVVQSGPTLKAWTAMRPARVTGIAFEPNGTADEDLLNEMDRRAITHSPLMPFPRWTNVLLFDVVDAGATNAGSLVFVCDYHLPGARDVAARHRVISRSEGGLLGVVDVAEIVVASPDPTSAASRWQRLLDPLKPEAGAWTTGYGPAIRIIEGANDAVERLVLEVASLKVAATHLNVLGAEIVVTSSAVKAHIGQLADLELELVATRDSPSSPERKSPTDRAASANRQLRTRRPAHEPR